MVLVLRTNCRRQQWFRNGAQLCRLLSLSVSPPYLNLTQEDLVKLPLARFTGDCILISTPQDEEKYASEIDSLFTNRVLGFDTEWQHYRPRRAPSLVQLASDDVCIMWRLCYKDQEKLFVGVNFPPKLLSLLNTHKIVKVGHSSNNDAYLLLKHYYVNSCSIFNTHPFSRELGLPMESLRGLAGVMLGMQVTKKQAKTNWENRWLSDVQLQYASTDAWISLKVYEALMKYATIQGVVPAQPARTAFQFVPTVKERKYLEKMVRRARIQRRVTELKEPLPHTIATKKASNEPQHSRAITETQERKKPLGILERIREVINHFLLKIEAAEQSTPPCPSFSGTSDTPTHTHICNSRIGTGPCSDDGDRATAHCSGVGGPERKIDEMTHWSLNRREVFYGPLHCVCRRCDNLSEVDILCERQPVASATTHGSHMDQGQNTFHKKVTVVGPRNVDKNETEPLYCVGEGHKNIMEEESRDWMTATTSEDGIAYNKSHSTIEQSKCDSKCVNVGEGVASLSSLEVNSSVAETSCYGCAPCPQVVADNDVMSTDTEVESSEQARLARSLVIS